MNSEIQRPGILYSERRRTDSLGSIEETSTPELAVKNIE